MSFMTSLAPRPTFELVLVRLEAKDATGKPRRIVPLNDDAFAALVRLRRVCGEYFSETRWVFSHMKPRYFSERIKDVRNVFETAVKRAGIPHATPHCLRHTTITESVHAQDANVVDISRVAGLKNLKTAMG